MEMFAFVALIAAGFVALALALKAAFWVVAVVVLPLFWLWMLVDAIIRPAEEYPTKTANEKILWIVLMIVFQVSAAVYWFMVWRAARSREAVGSTSPAAETYVAPTAMVPVPQSSAPAQPPAV
jgi:hypothetical protein